MKCRWPGCPVEVKPGRWGCGIHWPMLPVELREKVWETDWPGKEVEYRAALKEIGNWIADHN